MIPRISRLAALAGLVALAACAGTSGRMAGTEVTRFHLGAPIPNTQIAIEPADPARGGLEFQTYAAIVGEELARLGYAPTSLESSELVAIVDVERGMRELVARRSPFSIGIGGGTGGGGVGVGAGASIPVGGSGAREVAVTQLSVGIKRRSEGTMVWEGRAVREDAAGEADPAMAVRRLASALFQDFPGESGATIIVE